MAHVYVCHWWGNSVFKILVLEETNLLDNIDDIFRIFDSLYSVLLKRSPILESLTENFLLNSLSFLSTGVNNALIL